MKLLNIGSRSEFDEIMQEAICSNLYFYLTVILQNIDNAENKDFSQMYRKEYYDTDTKKYNDSYRHRVDAKRLDSLSPNINFFNPSMYMEYKVPVLLKAYKQALFVSQTNGEFKASGYFLDVFLSLMYSAKTGAKDKKSNKAAKMASIWMFSLDDVKRIENLYESTFSHKEFADALKYANEKGVIIICLSYIVKPESLKTNDYVKKHIMKEARVCYLTERSLTLVFGCFCIYKTEICLKNLQEICNFFLVKKC